MPSRTELIEESIAAFSRGDVEAAVAAFENGVVVRPAHEWPENHTRLGLDAGVEFFRDLISTLGGRDLTIVDRVDSGDRVSSSTSSATTKRSRRSA